MKSRERITARLIVVDNKRRLLLLQYDDAEKGRFWATPGGALEPGESFEEAAAREAFEELGLKGPSLTKLWRQTVEILHRGVLFHQLEQFFLTSIHADELAMTEQMRREHALEGILEMRWWSLDELAAAPESVYPEGLLARLRQLFES